MLHILDKEQSGEIFAFSNGSISFWGLQPSQQEKFLDLYIRDKQKSPIKESSEFTVDEDEVTDLKGDVILLNPEGIQLSKLAFSYGLGRAAKFNSIEHDLDDVMYLLHESLLNGTRDNKQWLLLLFAMILSDKISNQSVNTVTQRPQAPEPPTN